MSTGISIFRDLRFALMSLRRSPGFTFIAIVTLGLGIGANTSAFGIFNEVMLRPLPYPDTDRLERIYRATPQNSRGGVSPADYLDLEEEMSGYGEIAAYALSDMSLSNPGEPAELARGARTSANLFSTLGVGPRLGRSFTPDEDVLGNHRVLIISDRYWQNRFGGDPGIIGRTVRVNGEPHDIVGVLPASFHDWRHLGPIDLFRPLGFTEEEMADRGSASIRLVGRRSENLTPAQAEAFIANFGRRLAEEHPVAHAGTTWRTLSIDASVAPEIGPPLLSMVIGLSTFVLLIACSNLANLLLARTMARAREFAVRSALGASRRQLLRPLLLESLLLAFGGGIFALFVAEWTSAWLRSSGDGVHPIDWRVISWAFGACVFTAVAFGLAPALYALRLDPNSILKSGSRGTTADRGQQRFRQILIVGQFALALVLLTGAALFMRGLEGLNNRRFGWESEHLVTGTILLPTSSYAGKQEITDFHRLTRERLEALPGVASASISYSMPFFGLAEPRKYLVADREPPERGQEPVAVTNGVSPNYFETVGTPVLSGRTFDYGDELTSPRVFVINQTMAAGLFGGESPLGRRLGQMEGDSIEWGEIVGVVGDVRSVYPDRPPVEYQVYHPMAQEPRLFAQIAVRTGGMAPSGVVESVRAAIAALDPDLPVRGLQAAEVTIAEANAQWGTLGTILSFLALLGLGLAALGIYGVIARAVAERTSEFGIRLALGAVAEDISRLVLSSGVRLAIIGAAIGLFGAVGISRLLRAFFPNMPSGVTPVLGGVTVLLIGVALIACYIPARRAARTSLTESMRAL